jgi:hypothetical protein
MNEQFIQQILLESYISNGGAPMSFEHDFGEDTWNGTVSRNAIKQAVNESLRELTHECYRFSEDNPSAFYLFPNQIYEIADKLKIK